MGKIVVGYALSHSSMMVSQPELVDEKLRTECYDALDVVRQDLVDLGVTRLLIIGGDHFNSYYNALYPQWCVGRAESYEGWADNIPLYEVAGDAALGSHIVVSLLAQGFEPSFSDEMRLDHAFFGPMHFITPKMNIPVVPMFQNTLNPPFTRLPRCFALGEALANALKSSPDDERIAVIGSGGLSHWLGGPEHGRLNPEFDHEFLRRFEENDREWLTHFSDEEITELAGNGGHEIRNWLTVRGAMGSGKSETLFYAPLYPWFVGAAFTRITPEMSS